MLDAESRGPTPMELPVRPAALEDAAVAVWRESITLPTHLPAPPDRHPAYLHRRVYQGSSGRVFPLLFHDRIATEAEDVAWEAVHLENEWLRVVLLPALGGRIHVARDRARGYDIFYTNPVVKPALVGLAGPWIAGGVEFNWPQHHRPATFLPTDVEVEHEPDGAVTVWCSDHDPFARMKGMHGVRLRPSSAVLEVRARLYNRSEQPQTFLWWANVAARVHADYQSFFPRDVTVVADHARRAVTSFPASDRPYYGVDYPARHDVVATAAGGVEVRGDRLDWYRNIPVPTSYMCLGSREGFFGGYDHAARAGFVHVADTAVAVGKKQWTWGDADFGHAWDRNLADDGASYVELMAGVFTDNQPDFSHLAPGETKVFTHAWYPLHDVGPVHAATTAAAVRVDVVERPGDAGGLVARVGVVLTAERTGCELVLTAGGSGVVARHTADGGPGRPVLVDLPLDHAQAAEPLELVVTSRGDELVRWSSVVPPADGTTTAATEPAAPAQVGSVEELALVGAHLEQYRHATRSPEPYWREALRRDPGHLASSAGLAQRALRRGRPADAEALLRPAVTRLTAWNANPADTTVLYLLGLALEEQGRRDEAYELFARASWTRQWRAAAGYRMARLDAVAGRDDVALLRLQDVLRAEPEHLQARALTVVVLRRTGEHMQADDLARETLVLDPLDWWTRHLLGLPLAADAQTCVDVALEHAGVGELDAALDALDAAQQREADRAAGQPAASPLIAYHRAHLLSRLGREQEALQAARSAQDCDETWCFPVRRQDAAVLQEAITSDPRDARAPALLGHWLYAQDRHADAVEAWRTSVERGGDDPVTWRNLGLAAHDHAGDLEAARTAYDRARAAAPRDARLLYESDQLDVRRGATARERLRQLEAHRDLVDTRDDLCVQLAQLLLSAGRLEEARTLLLSRRFQPWEGGEGEVLRAWERLCRLQVRRSSRGGDLPPVDGAAAAAADLVRAALDPPSSLGEARHPLASTAELHLLLGDALASAGNQEGAREAWGRAAGQRGDFQAMATEEHSEATAFRVRALRRLARDNEAAELLERLRAHVDRLEGATSGVDYFATSLPSLLLFAEEVGVARRRRVAFLRAQLDVLDGRPGRAAERLEALLQEDPSFLDAMDLATALHEERDRRSGSELEEIA